MKRIILIIIAWFIGFHIFAQNFNCISTDNYRWIIQNTIKEGTYPYKDKAALTGTDFEEGASVTITAENWITMEISNTGSFIADSGNGAVFLAYIKPCEIYESEVLVPCDNISTELINEEFGGKKISGPDQQGVEYSDLAYYSNGSNRMLFMPLDDAITNEPDNDGAAYVPGETFHVIRAYDLNEDAEYIITLANMPSGFLIHKADLEGMTHLDGNYFAIIDEDTRVIYFLEYDYGRKELSYVSSYNVSNETAAYVSSEDHGIEGLSYNHNLKKLYLVSEGNFQDRDIIIFELDFTYSAGFTNPELTKSREFNLSEKLKAYNYENLFKDAAAIYHLSKAFPDGSKSADRFLVLSQESEKILEMDMEGTFYGTLTDVGGEFQPEGIAFVDIDNTKKIVLANEGQKEDDGNNKIHISAKINKYNCDDEGSQKLLTQTSDYTNIKVSPNPVFDVSIISYNLIGDTKVSVFITDVLGNQITTLVDDELQQAGINELMFDGSAIPTGIYFCTVRADDKVHTQKLVKAN